jgi:hypothetical protein
MVIVLIGAVFAIGKMVNPPPPGPPEPPKKAPVGTPAMTASRQKEMRDQMKKMMEEKMKHMPKPPKNAKPGVKPFDPNSIDVTPEYFKTNSDGAGGERTLEQKVAIAKKEQEEERLRNPPHPMTAPRMAPTPPVPVGAAR